MSNEEVERAIEFLLDNQAQHDVRLARLENIVVELAVSQKEMRADMQTMRADMQTMLGEFREGIEHILGVAERAMTAVHKLADAEFDTRKRVRFLEDRVDILEEK